MANATTAGAMFQHTLPSGPDGQPGKKVDYELSPIDLEDLEYLEMQVRADLLRIGRLSIPADATPEQQIGMMRPIIDYVLSFDLLEGNNMQRVKGVAQGVHNAYCMLRHKQPNITLAQVRDIMTNSTQEFHMAQFIVQAGQREPEGKNGEQQAKKKLDESVDPANHLPETEQPPALSSPQS
jgi:hypothetical protein